MEQPCPCPNSHRLRRNRSWSWYSSSLRRLFRSRVSSWYTFPWSRLRRQLRNRSWSWCNWSWYHRCQHLPHLRHHFPLRYLLCCRGAPAGTRCFPRTGHVVHSVRLASTSRWPNRRTPAALAHRTCRPSRFRFCPRYMRPFLLEQPQLLRHQAIVLHCSLLLLPLL